MKPYRTHLPSRGLLLLLSMLVLLLSACSRPAGEAGPGDIEPLAPVAPEAPVPEADEQPDPNVALTAEAAGDQSPLIGVGLVQTVGEAETLYQDSLFRGAYLAIQQINENGYLIDGRRMALMIGEEVVVTEEEENEFVGPLSPGDMVAVVGPVLDRGESDAGEDVAVPLVLLSQTDVDTNGGTDYVENWIFRSGLPSGELTVQIAASLRDQMGLERVAILTSDATVEDTAIVVEGMATEQVEVVATGNIDQNQDWADLLAEIVDLGAEAVILNTPAEEAVQILSEAEAAGISEDLRFIVAGNLFNPAFLEQAGELSVGLMGGTTWLLVNATAADDAFRSAYVEAYGDEPDAVANKAYTAIWMLAEAINQSSATDVASLRGALESIGDFETPVGTFQFDPQQRAVDSPVLLEVGSDGEISIVDGAAE